MKHKNIIEKQEIHINCYYSSTKEYVTLKAEDWRKVLKTLKDLGANMNTVENDYINYKEKINEETKQEKDSEDYKRTD